MVYGWEISKWDCSIAVKQLGPWVGTKIQNDTADFKVAEIFKNALCNYENEKNDYEKSYLKFWFCIVFCCKNIKTDFVVLDKIIMSTRNARRNYVSSPSARRQFRRETHCYFCHHDLSGKTFWGLIEMFPVLCQIFEDKERGKFTNNDTTL